MRAQEGTAVTRGTPIAAKVENIFNGLEGVRAAVDDQRDTAEDIVGIR